MQAAPNHPPTSAEALLLCVMERGQGWMEAFGDLVRMHEGWIRGFLRARISDWAAADDLAQEVFVTAFRRISTYKADASFESWLRGIAINHLRNFIRKRRELCIGGSEEMQELIDQGTEAILHGAGENQALDALRSCLERIDGPSRELLDQRYGAGRTVREISASSGRGYSALTMQLHRLREILADCVQRKLEASGT